VFVVGVAGSTTTTTSSTTTTTSSTITTTTTIQFDATPTTTAAGTSTTVSAIVATPTTSGRTAAAEVTPSTAAPQSAPTTSGTEATSAPPTSTLVEVQGIQVTRSTSSTPADTGLLAAPEIDSARSPVAILATGATQWLMIPLAAVVVLGGVGWALRRMPATHGRHRR
jgi:hypothetical protein